MITSEGSRLQLVEAGALRLSPRATLEARLAQLARELRDLVERLAPDEAAVEDVFVKVDARAALAIGHGRGVALSILGERGIAVAAYPPATVKRSVAGNGRAAKQQVAWMAAQLLGETELPGPEDATDALAVAITHSLRRNLPA